MKNLTTNVTLNAKSVNMEIEQTLSCTSTEYFKHVLALGEPVSTRELGLTVKWVKGTSFDDEGWWVRSGGRYDSLCGQAMCSWGYDYENDTALCDEFSFHDVVEHLNRRDVEELFWGYKSLYTTNEKLCQIRYTRTGLLLKGETIAVKCDGIWYVSRETLEEFLLACGR